jgi:chromosome segregation ATPase
MQLSQLKQLIKEAIHDRLTMIDEAGNKAAIQAKIAKIEEDIQEAHGIKSNIPENIRHYVDSDIIEGMMGKLEESIQELEAKKTEYEEQMAEMEKPVKEAKKKPSAGMTKKEKSAVAKKAQAGKDIGKPGKSFKDVAKEAGGGEKGTIIAAASMWKGQAK